ncbi:LysR family transcriptional regulator [Thioalkalivibrio sp. XN8]|uniref:LysR family transcriptional regulator n=1 Tax=Thioalkalivibrio sp. XN8 TaxID=2712863 RepID=UPI0013EDBBA0|nr:LysR family transcriptional regulator [Thioalkalivibrio sp. XN8]NGP53160.1 LysR family transcriptional regulator [Thioalkalivibrio sp. XN8]
MRFKLRQLAHALAVWKHHSFRRAAEEQHISQPALSRSIHNLEESLGVQLFDREATEVTLTAFGEVFLHRAQALLVEADELEREMNLMKGLGVGRFSVAMGANAARVSGIPALAQLLAEHPGLQVRLEHQNWRDTERLVRNRQVDLGFGEIAHLQEASELYVESVAQHEVVFFCRAGHPLLGRDMPVTTGDIDAYTFVGPPVPYRLAHLFPRNGTVDEKTGDIFPPVVVEDLNAVCAIVAATDAFGVCVPVSIEPRLRSGEIAVVPFRAPWLRVDYGFIRLAARSVSPAAAAFMALVRAAEPELEQRNRALMAELFGRAAPAT